MATRNALGQMARLSIVEILVSLLLFPLTATASVAATTSGAVFLHKMPNAILNDQTNSLSVGTDPAGGLHAAFANFSSDPNGDYHVYYDYCAPGLDCATASTWTLVNLMTISSTTTILDEDQLALDPQGHPRIMIVTTDNGGSFLDHYIYAACDSACTASGNWSFANVADVTSGVNVMIFDANKHFFALDAQGRPRFVLDNGLNYVYELCNSACTSPASWNSVSLGGVSNTNLGFNTPALALTATGLPRLLAPVQDPNTFQTQLVYWECSLSDCGTNASSWISATLNFAFSGISAAYSSLKVTQGGQPRFAYYGTPGGQPESLYYFSCSSACTDAAHWGFTSIGLAPASGVHTSGQEPDLALDSHDHPRLSFQSLDNVLGAGLGYAWCDANCESGPAGWQSALADSNTQLNADWDRLGPFCTFNSWTAGYRSALVLDAAGNPRIGYDAEHYASGCTDPTLDGQDYRSVRFVFFRPQQRLYLPLVLK